MENYWDNKNVLVTGGTGFIGTWLSKELLDKGANLYCITNNTPSDNTNFYKLGLLEKTRITIKDLAVVNPETIKEYLEKNEISAVFHLAGQPILSKAMANPFDTININILGTAKVLEACRRCETKLESIVISSSINAYGGNGIHACKEDDPLRGIFPYEVSMASLDSIAQSYATTFNMPIGVARFSNIYGPGDLNFERLIPASIKNILNNEKIELKNNGETQRGFLHVYDAVQGLICLAEHVNKNEADDGVFNFGPDETCKTLEVVNILINYSKSGDNNLVLIPGHPTKERTDQFLDTKKSKRIIGWNPQIKLEQGLADTFDWYKKYLNSEK
ncbi:MAG: GDP-mannose 4,6-dehydratase [archaeon]|nr:GDP-mannose 4,6-dehydratase [archaeon]